jgi:hypothetical protein
MYSNLAELWNKKWEILPAALNVRRKTEEQIAINGLKVSAGWSPARDHPAENQVQ